MPSSSVVGMSERLISRVRRASWLLSLFAVALFAAACGGDDDSGSTEPPAADVTSDEDDATSDDETSSTAGGAVEGALVSVLSFDFGLWALDPDGGDAFEVTVPDTGFSDRQDPALVSPDGSTAVVMVFTTVEGQTFANDVGLGAIDLATGEGRLVVELGQDRPDDESTEFSSWELIGVSDTTAWVVENAAGVEGEALVAVDLAAGTTTVAVAPADSRVRSAAVLDNTLYGEVNGTISRLGASGWESLVTTGDLPVDPFVTPATIADFAITRSGAPLEGQWAEDLLRFLDMRPTAAGMVAAGDSLYWQFNENWTDAEGTDSAIVGGFVEFDPARGELTAVWPIGPSIGAFPDENEISTSSQGTWHTTGDTVWFADARDDGDLLRLDPASGVTVFGFEPVPGADYTRIEVLPSDPDGVWLVLEDWTITQSDESGTSATGDTRFVLVDPDSGALVVEVDESDLIGF